MADAGQQVIEQEAPAGPLLPDQVGAQPPVDQSELFSYRPALDGLRAVAVIAVLLYHGAQLTSDPLDLARGGFLGVDLFFVLSGFLITTLLLTEVRRTGRIRLRGFWMRRARRLLPALLLVIAAVAIAFLAHDALDFDAIQLDRFPRDALSALFYVANWGAAFSGLSYFDRFGGVSPLRHMWSLGIEEQFYLLWPIIVSVGLVRFKLTAKTFAVLAAIGALASATLMSLWFRAGSDPSRIYYGTDTRAQALLVGAVAAFLLIEVPRRRLGRPLAQAAGWAGLLGCLAIFVLARDNAAWLYGGGFLLMAIAAVAAVIAASGPQHTAFARTLSRPFLVRTGMLSYGLYLWHWPVFVLLDSERTNLGGAALLAVRLAVTALVSMASYRFIEAPIRFGALRARPRRIGALAGAVACLVLVAVSVSVVRPSSAELALIDAPAESKTPVAAAGDRKILLVGDSVALSLGLYRGDPPERDDYALKTDAPLGCSLSSGDAQVRDSNGIVVSDTRECRTQFTRWQGHVRSFDPDLTMILFGSWEVLPLVKDGRRLEVGSAEFNDEKLQQLEQAFAVLTAGGGQVVVLTSPCITDLRESARLGQKSQEQWRIVNYNRILRTFAARHPTAVTLVDLHGLLCPTGTFTPLLAGQPFTEDGIHFTPEGGPRVWKWLYPKLDGVPATAR